MYHPLSNTEAIPVATVVASAPVYQTYSPYDHQHNQHYQQYPLEQQQYPLEQQQYQASPVALPYGVVYTKSSWRRRPVCRHVTRLARGVFLVLLNLANLAFITACVWSVVVVVGLSHRIGFLPAACLGLLLVHVLIWLAQPIAIIDRWLYDKRNQVYEALLNDR
ncbi:Aste57867_10003 [Aphanomyces stellatus]|uniref:Aste57867_10003 protein n=1 Tax=Aphanomyces stellatus TaxID=120398 RepID=A0A485KPM7_9STRA|nr:hypothetical protein As57867_009964 [Aphanomyces stellatus]VFT86881.1 Aste57867_10003 [Aphanomyces stellatus]